MAARFCNLGDEKDSVFHRQQHLHILKIHKVCAPIFRGVFSCRCLISVSGTVVIFTCFIQLVGNNSQFAHDGDYYQLRGLSPRF